MPWIIFSISLKLRFTIQRLCANFLSLFINIYTHSSFTAGEVVDMLRNNFCQHCLQLRIKFGKSELVFLNLNK